MVRSRHKGGERMIVKSFVFIVLVSVVAIYLMGCGKKQESLESMQQPMTMEELTALTTQTESKSQVVQAPPTPAPEVKLEPLPPSGPYKPTAHQIQTALKNVGLYTGAIDGKIGPKTLKAIEEFQRANGLEVDGKVGPKTWAVLSKYLNPQPPPIEKK